MRNGCETRISISDLFSIFREREKRTTREKILLPKIVGSSYRDHSLSLFQKKPQDFFSLLNTDIVEKEDFSLFFCPNDDITIIIKRTFALVTFYLFVWKILFRYDRVLRLLFTNKQKLHFHRLNNNHLI